MQHAVVSVDGKLIPFAYATNVKSSKLFWQGRTTANPSTTDNGTIRLNTNPMHRLDDDNPMDKQENFYHTLTPFSCHTQYEDCQSQTCSRNPTGRHRSYHEMKTHSALFRYLCSFDRLILSDASSPCHDQPNGYAAFERLALPRCLPPTWNVSTSREKQTNLRTCAD